MINVIDEVLAGEPKYTITHSDSTTEEVSIDLSTEVTTEGTPLNKALFDSINADINARVLISNKATNNEAIAGTDTSKYIVPSTLQAKLDNMNAIQGTNNVTVNGAVGTNTYTIFQPSSISSTNTGTVTIWGYVNTATSTNNHLYINGTNMYGTLSNITSSSSGVIGFNDSSQQDFDLLNRSIVFNSRSPFKITLNYNTKVGEIVVSSNNASTSSNVKQGTFMFSTVTSVQVQLTSTSSNTSNCVYSISYSR